MGLDNRVEGVEVSGFSEYIEFISNGIETYGQTGINPEQIQMIIDEHNGRTDPQVEEYFEVLADQGLIELGSDGMGVMPDVYSVTDKGRYILDPDNKKQIGEDKWAGQKDEFLIVVGENYSFEQPFASETVAETNLHGITEENAESYLEP